MIVRPNGKLTPNEEAAAVYSDLLSSLVRANMLINKSNHERFNQLLAGGIDETAGGDDDWMAQVLRIVYTAIQPESGWTIDEFLEMEA